VKTLENSKDFLPVLAIDANTIVLNGKQPLPAPCLGGDMNLRRLAAAVTDGVTDEVLEHLLQLKIAQVNARQRGPRNGCAALIDRGG
jgi:hypothetical protein